MSWNEYMEMLRESNSYRNRVKPRRLKSDMRKYGIGGNKGSKRAQKGSPFKNVKVSFKGKGFNDISGPALEEAEEQSFEIHDELQPDIWGGDVLNPEIRQRLMEITNDFLDELDVPIRMEDVRFTGSLANYNWSKYSDIDLHIVVDFSKIDENVQLVKAFFDQARMRWNDKHRIMIHGFEVEIYVENISEEHKSSGIYSLFAESRSAGDDLNEPRTAWLVKPDPGDIRIDFATADKKAQDYKDRVDCVLDLIHDEEYEKALRCIDRIKQKIRAMRKAGLESQDAEFSAENIAFKILRRDETLKKLHDLKYVAYDRLMTIKEE